jgi:hypothetical protein
MHSSKTDHDEHFWRVRRITPFDVALNPASPGEQQAMEMTEHGKHGKP